MDKKTLINKYKTMKQKQTLLLFACIVLFTTANAQSVKALYVNDFVNIVGDITAENTLLAQAQSNGYNYLILYNLYSIHNTLFDITNPVTAQPLADFIEKARTLYGITQVAGVGETYNSFNNIHDYNLDHAANANQQLDHYNIEFEFWNDNLVDPGEYYCTTYLQPLGLPCDTSGSFQFLIDNLCDLHTLCNGFAYLNSEMYIGWPNAGQSEQIADCTNRVLVHYYRGSDVYNNGNSIYNYGSHRLPDLAQSSSMSVVMPIFNCQPTFMGSWLDTNPESQVFDTWMNGLNGYNDDTGTWKTNTTVDGHVWFKYTCMPTGVLPIELIYFSGRKIKNGNLLNWQIEVEAGLVEIQIERAVSNNPSNFLQIISIENPYGINSSYVDEAFSVGINLYRLKFIYEDNSFEYSKTVALDNKPEGLNVILQQNNNNSFLSIESSFAQQTQVDIFSSSGQLLSTKSLHLNRGSNLVRLDIDTFPAGLFVLSVKTNEEQKSIKFIK